KQLTLRCTSETQRATTLANDPNGGTRWPRVSITREHSGFSRLLVVTMNLGKATHEGWRCHVEPGIQNFWFCVTTELECRESRCSASCLPKSLKPRCGMSRSGIAFYPSVISVKRWINPHGKRTPSQLRSTTGIVICTPMHYPSCGSIRFPRQ